MGKLLYIREPGDRADCECATPRGAISPLQMASIAVLATTLAVLVAGIVAAVVL